MNRICTLKGTRRRSRSLLLRIALVVVIGSVSSLIAVAQDKPPAPKRLKIGVALEGGGALGLAHIGVLRWFEQHHIPIDVISGTSMGGLVGGMYATGKSADELERIVKAIDWPLVIDGRTPYEDLSYRRKEDERDIQNDLVVGFRKGASLPSGLNAGHQIGLLIDRETLAYSDVKSFDDLPIPFRCVSTELISGKAHVFENGPIGLAMRSTMSLPAVFAPVRDGDRLYVDGALVDNLPTDLARNMGADVVIAIHLQVAPATADEIQSLFSVLGRAISVGTAATEMRGMEAADIVVKVDVQKFGALEFDKAEPLIQKGIQAAEEKSKILQPYALDQAAWTEYVAAREARKRGAPGVPQFVKVEGTNADAEKQIQQSLQPMLGKPIDTQALDNILTRVTGTGKIESASYGLTRNDGQIGLLVTVREITYGPPLLQPAFVVDGAQPENVTFTLGGRLTFFDVAGPGSELRTDLQFGNTYGINAELYKRFSRTSRWFIAPRVNASDSAQWLYSHNNPQADYRIGRVQGGVDIGYAVSRFSEVRAGYEIGYLNANLKLGTPEFSSVSGEVSDARFRFTTDHRDDPIVPRRGYLSELTFHWVNISPGAPTAFPTLDARIEFFKTVSRPASLFVVAEGGSTIGYERTGIPQYFLGGTAGLLAYGQNEVRGDQFYLFRAGYLHKLVNLPTFLGSSLYAVTFYEVAKMYNAPDVSRLPTDGAAGFIVRTLLGPVLLGGSVGDTGHANWFFALGRVF
jgi:NTE family protein